MHNIKIKTSYIRSGIVSFCLTICLVLVFVLTLSFLETQTQGRVLRAETQIEGSASEGIASENLSFLCSESVIVVCSRFHQLTRLAVREVGF
jgi:hypothetical protein